MGLLFIYWNLLRFQPEGRTGMESGESFLFLTMDCGLSMLLILVLHGISRCGMVQVDIMIT